MSEELKLNGLGVDPEVLSTIVTVAAEKVDGVACVDKGGLAGLRRKRTSSKGVLVSRSEDGEGLDASIHVTLRHGRPLRSAAGEIQRVVAEALESMTGQRVACVDVYIDGMVFGD